MATQYIIDINHNDELPVVIRKCNENFRALLSQRLKQGQITNADISSIISGVYEALTEEEAERVQADRLLQQLLNSNWFGNGAPTGSLDPSLSWTTEQAKSDHAGDLYWSTASSGAVWYWAKTGTPAAWQWNLLNISGGTGDKAYTHTQSTPSDTWVITHNMDKYPSITVEDSAHNDVIGDYTYNSVNQVTLVFNGAFSGWAYLN